MRSRALPALLLALAFSTSVSAEDTWKNVSRIVAVGDVHGDLAQFVAVLRSAGVIDKDNRWSGGKTHLVQNGDLLDRGPDSRQVIGLLMRLEKQAHSAGGEVHALIGNHETLDLFGDLRYVSAADFASYQTAESAALRNKFFEQHQEELRQNPQTVALAQDDAYRKKWDSQHPLGFFERQAAFAADGPFGKWIRGHNAIVKIDDMVFLHGGISPAYAKFSIRKINETITKELRDFSKLEGGMVLDQDGPLWYRGLAQGDEKELDAHVQAVLERFGAKTIVIGHTPTKGMILPRFDGKVLLIDVGLSAVYGSHTACLVVEAGKAFALHRGNKVLLPTVPADLNRYLGQIRAIDMAP